MHNLSANFKLESAMNLVFESFGAISSWMWTASIDRFPIILSHFRESLAKIPSLESTGIFLSRVCVELNGTNLPKMKFFDDFQRKYALCHQQI